MKYGRTDGSSLGKHNVNMRRQNVGDHQDSVVPASWAGADTLPQATHKIKKHASEMSHDGKSAHGRNMKARPNY